MITSTFLCAHRHGNLITRELAVGLCPFLSLVVRFGRSAAQILQNGPGQLGCAPCPFSGGPFWPPSKRTSPALPLGGGGVGGVGWGGGWNGVGWGDNVHVPVRTQARQPHQTRAGGGSLSLSLPGGPFWPLSSPNPPKRTSPAWSAWLCSLLSLVGLCPFLSLVVRFGRSAAQILQNGPRQLGQLGCAPCSPSGGPFWLLSSPNPPKRTSPAWSAWLCSLLSLWCSVLAAQRPKSSKTDLAMLVCLAVLLALPLVVRFGRSAPQILQNGPRQLGLLGCAPCSPSGGPFWPLSSPNPPKR